MPVGCPKGVGNYPSVPEPRHPSKLFQSGFSPTSSYHDVNHLLGELVLVQEQHPKKKMKYFYQQPKFKHATRNWHHFDQTRKKQRPSPAHTRRSVNTASAGFLSFTGFQAWPVPSCWSFLVFLDVIYQNIPWAQKLPTGNHQKSCIRGWMDALLVSF